MSILSIFRPLKKASIQRWKELGAYQSIFSVFGDDIYQSDTVRACVRPLADFSAKAEARCEDKNLERILNRRPNKYMNGHDFLLKVRTRLEILNTTFIYLERDDKGKVIGLYPVPYAYFEAVEYQDGLFIKFYFGGEAATQLTLPWEDLAVLRKDYNGSDIGGEDNSAIIKTIETLNTINQGLANSIKATANLRGILKSTKAMLSPGDVRKQKDDFVKDYLNLENAGGIASLDSTQEFIPVNMSPITANQAQMKETREQIYRYFGVNDDIVMGNIKTEQLENFYKLRIEPFLVALSQELTSKIYPGKAGSYEKNQIVYMASQGQFMTVSQKLDLFNKVVLYGGMTKNEWRHLMGYSDIEGGDIPIMRLDADYINVNEKPRQGNESVTSNNTQVAPVQQNNTEGDESNGSEE